MNRIMVIVLIVFLSSTNLFSQNDDAVLIFKDGTTMSGLAKLTNREEIKFRKTKKDKRKVYTFQEVDTLKIIYEPRTVVYTLVNVKNKREPLVLEVLNREGKIMHYQKTTYGGGMNSYAVHHTYLRKKGENEAIKFGTDHLMTKNFKKVATQFFADCEGLAQRIKNGEFERNEIKEIIWIYNEDCE